MNAFLVKYFAIIICSLYTYTKLINVRLSKTQVLLWVPITLLTTILAYLARLYVTPFNVLIIFACICISTLRLYHKTTNVTIVFSVVSLGISFFSNIFSIIISLPVLFSLFSFINNPILLDYFAYFFAGLIQFISIYFLFKLKRLKDGIIYIEKKVNNDLSSFIGIIILFLASLVYITDGDDFFDTIATFLLIIIGFVLLFCWKKHINNKYLDEINKRNIEKVEIELSDQIQLNSEITAHNQSLSKIIHRDNKLISAMEMAVEEILNCQSPYEQKKKAEALLPQLRAMSAERIGIVTEYETTNKKLPSTGIISVDSSLKYLLKRANDKNINFDLSVPAEISSITNNNINEEDLNTLILDLGENAIIATSDMEHRNVLIVMGYEDDGFCINIFDSGNHFDPKVISKLGIKRITTHKNTGGSGIGMMTTFELLQKYQASFILDETINSDKFAKKVSVHFDEKNKYHIQTKRAEIISIAKKRTDLIIN